MFGLENSKGRARAQILGAVSVVRKRAGAILGRAIVVFAFVVGILLLVHVLAGKSHGKRFASCLQQHGWAAVTRPNRLLRQTAKSYRTGWSQLASPREPGYAIVEPYVAGRFVLLAIGGRAGSVQANESLLFRHVEQAPGDFDGVMYWTGSKKRGEAIQENCLRAAGVPAAP
jgi:hypothetical protein